MTEPNGSETPESLDDFLTPLKPRDPWKRGTPKLNEEQKEEILQKYKEGAFQKDLAKEFNTTPQTIHKYILRAGILREPGQLPVPAEPTAPPRRPHRAKKVLCLNIEQTFQENLEWAIQSAGLSLRTEKKPTQCPNDTAYFLYTQACEDPKGFLGRFAQIQGKMVGEKENEELQQEGKRAISEIEEQLQTLDATETLKCQQTFPPPASEKIPEGELHDEMMYSPFFPPPLPEETNDEREHV